MLPLTRPYLESPLTNLYQSPYVDDMHYVGHVSAVVAKISKNQQIQAATCKVSLYAVPLQFDVTLYQYLTVQLYQEESTG